MKNAAGANVFVVCGGDFPDSVWATEAAAEREIARLKAEDAANRPQQRPIHFRSYQFKVQK